MPDSDSDAPEAISLSQSATAERRREENIQQRASNEKRKAKEINRARDERLKAQAAVRKEKGRPVAKKRKIEEDAVAEDGDTRRLQARMERAMAEASDEDDSELDRDDEHVDTSEGDLSGEGSLEEDGFDDMEDVEEEEASEAEAIFNRPSSRNYLPDHVFAAAASAVSAKAPRSTQQPPESTSKLHKKRKRLTARPKDIVIGSHAVRTLPAVHRTSVETSISYTAAPGATTSPARINRFLSKSLALKGQKKRTGQGWERKPVNIGLFKRSEGAPINGFVRGR